MNMTDEPDQEQLLPINVFKDLNFSLSSLVTFTAPGSHERRNMENAIRGINARVQWAVKQLELTGEGGKYAGPLVLSLEKP
jgi:hypothetical protein